MALNDLIKASQDFDLCQGYRMHCFVWNLLSIISYRLEKQVAWN